MTIIFAIALNSTVAALAIVATGGSPQDQLDVYLLFLIACSITWWTFRLTPEEDDD